ncbi:MAG TPA: ABC transporter ATP-binding protein [Blastocatellia bacterium]|nr:ABC transporter ATP-binding protein [Blastocatellia bacterium]
MDAGSPHSSEILEPLLTVRNLSVYFRTHHGLLKAVDDVSLRIDGGETLGLVGESGCGKSVTAFSILRLVPSPPGEYSGGQVSFGGEDLLKASEQRLRGIRGGQISIVFQEPLSSLNPILTIGEQIIEVIREHEHCTAREAKTRAIDMLGRTGISSPETRFHDYPHQLSGGMIQRAMIAMALVCHPRLLIADEPTTALDVTIQAKILDLLAELRREFQMAMLLITHDLGVVAETCDRVAVMYAGKIVEYGTVEALFRNPAHPYTHGLFRSLPSLVERTETLPVIPGNVPDPLDLPVGCHFRPRCSIAQGICDAEPALREIASGQFAACHFAESVITMARGSV